MSTTILIRASFASPTVAPTPASIETALDADAADLPCVHVVGVRHWDHSPRRYAHLATVTAGHDDEGETVEQRVARKACLALAALAPDVRVEQVSTLLLDRCEHYTVEPPTGRGGFRLCDSPR